MVGSICDNPIVRRGEIENFVLRHLRLSKKPLSEKELIPKIYNEYNEILSEYVMIRLKNKGRIIFTDNKWSIKEGR